MDFLLVESPNLVAASILLGIVAGLAYTFLIPLVTQAIEFRNTSGLNPVNENDVVIFDYEVNKPKYALTFFSLCVFILIARTASMVLLQKVANSATKRLRISIYSRITQLPIQDLERIGSSRLYATIVNDVPFLVSGASALPGILIGVSTIFGMLGFLVYLNFDVFVFIIFTIIFGIVTYRIPLFFGNRHFQQVRNRFDNIQAGIQGLVSGAKELKLNQTKKSEFLHDALIEHEESYRKHSDKGALLVIGAMSYGNLIAFFAIGISTFILSNRYAIAPETLVSIVMAMLYITGPLGAIIMSISPIVRGNIALKNLNKILDEMPIETKGERATTSDFDEIKLRNIELSYHNNAFALGPVDLTLRRGEINFIVGGNGSGKSTLAKILTLHYVPNKGQVTFGDEVVTDENRDYYRQHISAIYSDYHLFPKLYDVSQHDLDNKVPEYLNKLKLSDKVSIEDAGFSTLSLSDGQKRRLALLVMYLEKRDVYLFDEWAADQDPEFRAVFYEQILPELKAAGKFVLVISHDDRYFNYADNIIHMADGKPQTNKPDERVSHASEDKQATLA
ncbi:hypothetical protein A7985_23275 [Pseudoalteromonas luteoviolacea]|uniref:Cyclic peptide export ABC transporter n=1 Tax=Pseudoalteromonas luteoviolacea TaxID=43657 RepID=A0A1C0TJP1_9GAMM|nr:hypothetical protein A7985_23275 [Pseudoalteromonas luteoviolacea]